MCVDGIKVTWVLNVECHTLAIPLAPPKMTCGAKVTVWPISTPKIMILFVKFHPRRRMFATNRFVTSAYSGRHEVTFHHCKITTVTIDLMNREQFHSWTSTEVPLKKLNNFWKLKMNRELHIRRITCLQLLTQMEQRNKHWITDSKWIFCSVRLVSRWFMFNKMNLKKFENVN